MEIFGFASDWVGMKMISFSRGHKSTMLCEREQGLIALSCPILKHYFHHGDDHPLRRHGYCRAPDKLIAVGGGAAAGGPRSATTQMMPVHGR